MRIEAFIQARMGSTRLPGKVLKEVLGRPLLDYLVERVAQASEIAEIVILTTTKAADDPIALFCQEKNLPCFRGSEEDVLERYYQCALQRKPDGVVRITADCPVIDPEVIDQVVAVFRESWPALDYVSNGLERTFPRGLDVEVFSYEALEIAYLNGKLPEEREHVTPFIYRHPELFNFKNVSLSPSMAQHRWTVDTPEDFELIKLLIEHLYPEKTKFRLKDMLELISRHPEWSKLNAHIEQKKL